MARLLERNKVDMWYSLLIGTRDLYQTDDMGNVIYKHVAGKEVPVVIGSEYAYSKPVKFRGILSFGGSANVTAYGIDKSDYDAVLSVSDRNIPISETSLIWHKNEIVYKDADKTVPDANSAEYSVIRVLPTTSFSKFGLKHCAK